MASIYLETSFISACVIERDDPASLYRKQMSLDWWIRHGPKHELFISAEVEGELSDPDFKQGDQALTLVKKISTLAINAEVSGFAELLVREKAMPGPVDGDAIHVAVATIHEIEYILSWNVRHLANKNKIQHLQTICLRVGRMPPSIVLRNFGREIFNGN